MRILFTSTAGTGHMNPLFPLARAARTAGHQVLFAVPATGRPIAERNGFAAAVTESGIPSADEAEFWRGLPGQPDGNTYVFAGLFGRLRARAAFAPIGRIADDFGPDLIISEQAEFAGPIQAELRGVPHVTVGIGSITLPGADFAPAVREINSLRAEVGLPSMDALPWEHRTQFVTGLPDVLQLDPTSMPASTLRYRFEDAEGPVGPVSRKGDRVRVYASLGTAAAFQTQVRQAFSALLTGLGSADADVTFTVGALDLGSLGPIPPNVRVAPYLPQQVAMQCDIVVTHGGSGTTAAALTRGLPIVAIPLFADQPHNATQIARAGVGVVVDQRRIATDVAPAITTVAGDPSYAAAAQRISREIGALPGVGEVFDQLVAQITVAA